MKHLKYFIAGIIISMSMSFADGTGNNVSSINYDIEYIDGMKYAVFSGSVGGGLFVVNLTKDKAELKYYLEH